MPSRLLREGIIDSEAVNALNWPAEVFYRRLMSVVDDFGRYDARPAVLRSRLYPLKLAVVSEADVSSWLAECERAGLVSRYAVESKPYLMLHKLGSPRTKASKWPGPSEVAPELQMRADENICKQMRADVPGSGSGSGAQSGSGKSPAPRGEEGEFPGIPPPLDTPEFREAWDDWLGHHRDIRKPYKPRGAKALLRQFGEMGVARAVAAIRNSIANNYQGIVEPRHVGQPGGGVGSDSRVRAPAGKYANVPVIRVGDASLTGVGGEAGSPGEAPDAEADRAESSGDHPGGGKR